MIIVVIMIIVMIVVGVNNHKFNETKRNERSIG
jgi:hypothetical protein